VALIADSSVLDQYCQNEAGGNGAAGFIGRGDGGGAAGTGAASTTGGSQIFSSFLYTPIDGGNGGSGAVGRVLLSGMIDPTTSPSSGSGAPPEHIPTLPLPLLALLVVCLGACAQRFTSGR
jgi:hypothetical protein